MRPIVVYDPITESVKFTRPEGQVSGFRDTPAIVSNHSGKKVAINDIIRCNSITLLFFGNAECEDTMDIIPELKEMVDAARLLRRKIEVVYIPAYTISSHHANQWEERNHFMKHHGDWYYMNYNPIKSKNAKKMHWVKEIPAIVMLGSNGVIIDSQAERNMSMLRDTVIFN
uniref:Thioredoxin-like fold domain-containing protein n=1 Tax=Cuerna arida TaxID=1464854 RepID=A0A1B6GQ23_9HEMI